METQYPSWNLRLVNAFVGMLTGAPGLPSDLREQGYRLHYMEMPFRNSRDDIVKPELIMYSRPNTHAVMIEGKTGGNIDLDQLSRYQDVTSRDLIERAKVPRDAFTTHELWMVVGNKPDICASVLEENGYHCPLLYTDEEVDALRLVRGKVIDSEVHQRLTAGIAVDWTTVPVQFVPIDLDTPAHIITSFVGPAVVRCLISSGQGRISVSSLYSEVIPQIESFSPNTVHLA